MKRISIEEHEAKMAALKSKLSTLAQIAGSAAEEDNVDAMVQAITAGLNSRVELNQKIEDLEAKLTESSQEFAGMKELAEEHEKNLNAANEKLQGITALFGEKAKAEGFDVVKAVGDIAPESFTGSDPVQQQRQEKPEHWTELDELGAMFDRGDISATEFRLKVRDMKPNKLTAV